MIDFINRTLNVEKNGLLLGELKVSFEPPQPDNEDWYCPFKIGGLGVEMNTKITGIDGLQAFILALEVCEASLVSLENQNSWRILWLGEKQNRLG